MSAMNEAMKAAIAQRQANAKALLVGIVAEAPRGKDTAESLKLLQTHRDAAKVATLRALVNKSDVLDQSKILAVAFEAGRSKEAKKSNRALALAALGYEKADDAPACAVRLASACISAKSRPNLVKGQLGKVREALASIVPAVKAA